MDLTEFSDIAPFTDEEADAALTRLSNHPNTKWVSKFIFPDKPETFLGEVLRNIHTVDQFQSVVMAKAIQWVIDTSMTDFSYDGLENLKALDGKYVAMSNHRDIILDPALVQIILQQNHLPETQICVGDNLLKFKSVELLIRSNRMIKVIRGISARELYLSSQLLSRYIRETVTSGTSSVWIAQRQGRTKDGLDTTEQGLLKMLDMSGTKGFVENFKELNILPMSISYEYEPCDVMKARELLISRSQKYVKGETEDLESIMTRSASRLRRRKSMRRPFATKMTATSRSAIWWTAGSSKVTSSGRPTIWRTIWCMLPTNTPQNIRRRTWRHSSLMSPSSSCAWNPI